MRKHGFAPLHGRRASVYDIWRAMRSRCRNPRNTRFAEYGGRGIAVCDRWNDFQAFLSDMGVPADGMSIERIDNDLGYCPENCVWIPHRDQNRNRRYNWRVSLCGEEMTAREATRRLGLGPCGIAAKLREGGFRKSEVVDLNLLMPAVLEKLGL